MTRTFWSVLRCLLCLAVMFPGVAQAQESFYLQSNENSTVSTILQTSCTSASEYAGIKSRIESTGSSATAMANSLVFPQRNKLQVLKTDLAIYEAYYPSACDRTRVSACAINSPMTAEQACDCAAGYPGDVRYGVGVGEVLASANQDVGRRACAVAVQRASGIVRARYMAQLGRAQFYASKGTYEGATSLRQASALGYKRAEIDIARAYLRDLEFGGEWRGQAWLSEAMQHLAIARQAGAREAPMVVESFAQLAAVRQLNIRVFELWRQFN